MGPERPSLILLRVLIDIHILHFAVTTSVTPPVLNNAMAADDVTPAASKAAPWRETPSPGAVPVATPKTIFSPE